MKTVYVLTYYDMCEDPVVAVFDNSNAAYDCYEYFLGKHVQVHIDEVPVYKDFAVPLLQ